MYNFDLPLWVTLLVWRLYQRRRTFQPGVPNRLSFRAYLAELNRIQAVIDLVDNPNWIERIAIESLRGWIKEQRSIVDKWFDRELEVMTLPYFSE